MKELLEYFYKGFSISVTMILFILFPFIVAFLPLIISHYTGNDLFNFIYLFYFTALCIAVGRGV